MKKLILIVLCIVFPMLVAHAQDASFDDVPLLVKKVVVTGFKLADKNIYKSFDKQYRNKRLTPKEIETVKEELMGAYRRQGYVGLVDVSHQLRRGILTFHVGLSKQ